MAVISLGVLQLLRTYKRNLKSFRIIMHHRTLADK
jgi:hypothetical protein